MSQPTLFPDMPEPVLVLRSQEAIYKPFVQQDEPEQMPMFAERCRTCHDTGWVDGERCWCKANE